MNKLLMIADDFTGALDTGVQFATFGAATCVFAKADGCFTDLDDRFQVVVVNANSRHLSPGEAYEIVGRTVRDALRVGFTHIYKKTDSALRGNVGAELAAVMDAGKTDRMAFFPAFPAMGRVTRQGVHYIDGVPVAESVFGQDPFDPVCHSAVAEILAEQTAVPVVLHSLDGPEKGLDRPGIHVYDALTDEDLRRAAVSLKADDALHCLAGCAGLAAVLPELLEMPRAEPEGTHLTGRLLVLCGSVNPITVRQMDCAERAGALRIRLTPELKLHPEWFATAQGQQTLAGWARDIQRVPLAIVECGVEYQQQADALAQTMGLSPDQTRERVSDTMGVVLQKLLDLGVERDLLVTGGDTLLSFMDRIGQNRLIPLEEPMAGVALSRISCDGRNYNLLSKSGGFGADTLLWDLVQGRRQSNHQEGGKA